MSATPTGLRRQMLAIAIVAAVIGTALMSGAGPGIGPGLYALADRLGVAHLAGRPSPYRYHFNRPPRGAITSLLRDEIAFYESRIARTPQSGLDRAGLAGAYLKMARVTGDLRWYLLAENSARESVANLPMSLSLIHI